MRLLFGILILLTLFSAAALWQRSWTNEARSSREPFPSSVQEPGPAAQADGWSRVVLGRPSGGAPYEVPPSSVDGGTAEPPHGDRAAGPIDAKQLGSQPAEATASPPNSTPVQPAKDAVITVQAGQTLSEICRDRYGTARLELVLALARYNRMAGPDELREGQEILLPALESLREER